MEARNIPVCKAFIQEGLRKGQTCKFPPDESGYCGRHERNKIYDNGINEGKNWCRFFFRGCNNTIEKGLTCESCLKKKHEGKQLCKHEGCNHHTKETDYCNLDKSAISKSFGFCKKHERDIYYIEEKEKGFKYCDIARGCFSICDGDKKSCNECLEKERVKDKERYDKRKELHNALKQVNSDKRICVDCGNEYNKFITKNNHESKRCNYCNEMQHKQDKKRTRERNYKNENYRNKEKFFKDYIKGALKREYEFTLTFEEFSELIDKECFYCHYYKDKEVNGIDRVDNSKGYTKENSVPCCELCNRIKLVYHPIFFIEKCKIIGNSTLANEELYNKWIQYYNDTKRNFNHYKKETIEKRDLPFELTQDQWDTITREPCYLCGFKPIGGVGLDRVDNTIRKYTIENVKPCCGSCNIMKGELELETFVNKCKQIATIWRNTEYFNNIPIIQKESKILQTNPEKRKVWKALGLYYTILNNEEQQFYEFYKEVLKEKELEALCIQVKKDPKQQALTYLSKFLQNLKDRRKRLALKTKNM